jgi:SAM-dependent methyltransferase
MRSIANDPLGRWLLARRVRVVLPRITGRLLDIGCGTNELVRAYPGEGVGVDVFPWDGVDLLVEDSARLPFESRSFDTVAIVAALNHIPRREAVLAEAHRLLRREGRLVVTMIPPRISRLWHLLRRPWDRDQRLRVPKPGEVPGMTARELRRLLTAASFEVVEERRFMLGLNCMLVAERR